MKPKKEHSHAFNDIGICECGIHEDDIPAHPDAITCREKVSNLSRGVPDESLISSQVSDGIKLNKEIEDLKYEIALLYKYPPASMTVIEKYEKKLTKLLNKSGENLNKEKTVNEDVKRIKIWTAGEIYLQNKRFPRLFSSTQFIEVEELKKVIYDLKMFDCYYKMGKANIWRMSNDEVCDKTQEFIYEWFLKKLGLDKVK